MEWKITCTYINNTIGGSLDKEEVKKAMWKLRKQYNIKTIKEVDYMLKIKV